MMYKCMGCIIHTKIAYACLFLSTQELLLESKQAKWKWYMKSLFLFFTFAVKDMRAQETKLFYADFMLRDNSAEKSCRFSERDT